MVNQGILSTSRHRHCQVDPMDGAHSRLHHSVGLFVRPETTGRNRPPHFEGQVRSLGCEKAWIVPVDLQFKGQIGFQVQRVIW